METEQKMQIIKTVSCIITTHERDPHILKRAIDSVLIQTYINKEIIVVDDAPEYSKHNEIEELIESYNGSVNYIINYSRRGACGSRNIGIEHSKGTIIALLDDDDVWNKNKLEHMVPLLNNKAEMVYCMWNTVKNDRLIGPSLNNKHYEGNVFQKLLIYGNFIGGCSVPIFLKCCAEKIGGFDETLSSSQDYDFYLRYLNKYKIAFCAEELVTYYFSRKAISNSPDKIICGYQDIIRKHESSFNEVISAKKRIVCDMLYYCYVYNRKETGSKTYQTHKNIVRNNRYIAIRIKARIKRIALRTHIQER